MKKILLLLVSAVFALTAYAQENGNGNDNGSGNIPTAHNETTVA